ncbi:MAG: putative metalloprotease CJM1_0395 family protein [Vampirovibrionales bacterium]|nr:putative metalloprotease CJM1_0395 family protein [Vampirovibrionales bacterium]
MDLAFGAGLIKAAVVGPQALFGAQMQAATSLATSIETLGAGQRFLRLQEQTQRTESMNRGAFAQQQQEAQFASENQYQQTYARAMARHAEVVSHEHAHQAAAGPYAGGIHLEYHTQQVPMADGSTRTVRYAAGGHVPVHMPGMPLIDRGNPASAKAQLAGVASAYRQIAGAALAPHSPSGADAGVAASAHARLAQAQVMMAQLNHQPQQPKQPSDPKVGRRLNVVG